MICRYILIHTHQKGLFNNVCREGENFYRHLINYEKAVGSQGGVPGNDNSEATLRSNLHNQKCVVDNFTIGILHGEVRFLPLATSIIIHMNLILHVRYYAAIGNAPRDNTARNACLPDLSIGHMERARQAATMLVKLLVSLPKAFKAVLISRMEGTIKGTEYRPSLFDHLHLLGGNRVCSGAGRRLSHLFHTVTVRV